MQVTTVRNKPKPFTWSYSRLKNFEACPKKHWHVDIAKDMKEEEGDSLLWGNAVHDALAKRIKDGKPLPAGMEHFEPWVQKILTGEGNVLVEQKLAITRDMGPTTFFGNDVWFRAVGDVIKLNQRVALIADWKTGKIIEDSDQLALSAACVFAHYPDVAAVRSEFIWLKEDAQTSAVLRRSDMPAFWNKIWPRVQALQAAHDTTSYPPKPGGLCKRWCPVRVCPHYGE